MIPHTFAKKASTYLAKIASPYFYTKLKNPFFIISAGRSGSTLLVTTLSSHRDIQVRRTIYGILKLIHGVTQNMESTSLLR